MHPTTQAHMKSHLHQATNHILYWIVTAKKTVPKNTQTRRNTGSLCLDKLVLGQREVGAM